MGSTGFKQFISLCVTLEGLVHDRSKPFPLNCSSLQPRIGRVNLLGSQNVANWEITHALKATGIHWKQSTLVPQVLCSQNRIAIDRETASTFLLGVRCFCCLGFHDFLLLLFRFLLKENRAEACPLACRTCTSCKTCLSCSIGTGSNMVRL